MTAEFSSPFSCPAASQSSSQRQQQPLEAHMTLSDDARALLTPYLRALSAKGHHGDTLTLSSACGSAQQPWIIADVGSMSASERLLLREFLDIISRLSTSERFQWRRVYQSFWETALVDPLVCSICCASTGRNSVQLVDFETRELLAKSAGPRFLLSFVWMHDDGHNQLEMLRAFLINDTSNVLSPEHETLLAKLTTVSSRRAAISTEQRPIELGLQLSRKKLAFASDMRALAKLLNDIAIHEQHKDGDSAAPHYEITSLWFPANKPLLPIEIDILIDILASETSTIRHLHLGNTLIMLTVAKRVQVYQQLLRTSVCSLPDSEPTLETLHLQKVPLVHEHLVATCSALRYPNSLKELHMEWLLGSGVACAPSIGNTALMWAWIAFGIFHPDSAARLDRLTLSGIPLWFNDTAEFREVIRNPHAGRQIWLLQHNKLPRGPGCVETPMPAGQRLFFKLKACTKLLLNPKSGSRSLDFVTLETEEYEAAITLAAWVCVIVPGCGFVWVPTAAILSRREEPSKCLTLNASRQFDGVAFPQAGANVKAFKRTKGSSKDDFMNILCVLRIIGHCLEDLSYTLHRVKFFRTEITQLLDACPNLKHLNLKGNELANVDALSNHFQTEQSQLSSIRIGSVGNETQVLSQLGVVLADPSCHTLRAVAINGAVDSPEVWEELARALRANQTLEHLQIDSAKSEHREVLTRLQAEFEKSTLSLRGRLAFVSAIQKHAERPAGEETSNTRSNLNKFDAVIVARIFAFAGKQRTLNW